MTVSVLLGESVAVLLEVALRVLEVVLVFVDVQLGEALLVDEDELEGDDEGVPAREDVSEAVRVSVCDDEDMPL